MTNTISLEERRKSGLASACVGSVWLGPICLAHCFEMRGPWWAKVFMMGFTATLLMVPVIYHRKYGIDLRPGWPWRIFQHERPDLAFSEGIGWISMIVGILGILLGAWFASWIFDDLVAGFGDVRRFPSYFTVSWLSLLLVTSGFAIVTSRNGVFVYRDSRTVTIWWGLAWPMFRQSLRFDEFIDVVVYHAPAQHLSLPQWRVWLRDATNSVTIRARNQADAERIANQLTEMMGVPKWRPETKAGGVED